MTIVYEEKNSTFQWDYKHYFEDSQKMESGLMYVLFCITDLCTPLPVPECQAVGHRSTLLPNAFGHQTINDALQVFDSNKAGACSPNAMYYLCNLLFPVCEEGIKKNPCGSFCQSKFYF